MRMILIILSLYLFMLLPGCASKGRFFSDQYLKTSGTKIVNQKGEEVFLYGFNIGNWLLIEPWMLKMENNPGIKSGSDIFNRLEKRFGVNKTRELYRTFMENYINEQDIADIAALGMNFIRVPFWHASLFDRKYSDRDFEYMDRIIGWAKKNHLYVLIDLQGAPGGQSTNVEKLGEDSSNRLWTVPENIQRTIDMWKKIATRYKKERTVAGYDLLSEASGAPSLPGTMKDLVSFYNVLYKTVREIDTNHMIFIGDSLQGVHRLPHPASMGWENVVYSFNFYPNPSDPQGFEALSEEFVPNIRRAQVFYNVPFHVGEFNSVNTAGGGIRAMKKYFKVFRSYGWSWNIWSYKKIEDNISNNWGLTGYFETLTDIDLDSATFEIVKDLFTQFNSAYMKMNEDFVKALTDFSEDTTAMKGTDRIRDDLHMYPEEGAMHRGKTGGIKLDWNGPAPHFASWGDDDSVSWLVNVPAEGVYAVRTDLAFGAKENKSPLVSIWLDGHEVAEIAVKTTGGWDRFSNTISSSVRLSAGRHIFSLRAKKADEGVMNLASVELVLSNSLPEAQKPDDESIRLSPLYFYSVFPEDAEVSVEWQNTPGNVGRWKDGEKMTWVFLAVGDASYNVSFDFSSTNPAGSSRFEITANADDRVNSVRLPKTAEPFQKIEAGKLRFTNGLNTITFTGSTKNRDGVGRLGEIRLQKIKRQEKP